VTKLKLADEEKLKKTLKYEMKVLSDYEAKFPNDLKELEG
jgi:hypothetical protein